MTAAKPKPKPRKPRVPRCPCGDGPILEPWPCCDECRRDHFLWPTPDEILAKGGAVVPFARAASNMGEDCLDIEVRVHADPEKHPNRVFFAWRKAGANSIRRRYGMWTKMGDHTKLFLASLMNLDIDRNMLHWWIQTLAGAVEDSVDLDPNGL